MHSPINYMKNYFLPDFITNSVKSPKSKKSKEKSNSLKSKKIVLSRNDFISNKNLIIKTKTNNNIDYKQINQFSSENIISLNNKNKKDEIINDNPDSLYKFLSPKIKENNHKIINHRKINYNNKNFNDNSKISSTKLDFSMSQINNTNNQIKEKKINFNKLKGVYKINKTSKNYYKKILNFPLSPNNNVKLLKINNTNNLHEIASPFNYINKEKGDFHYKRILSSKKLFNNKLSNNSENKNVYDNKINSFVCHNTNNINLNVNIINKGIILNSFSNNDNNNNSSNNILSFNKLNNSSNRNNRGHTKGAMTLANLKDISFNKENNNNVPEEIHFKAVKYMQRIKEFDENYA